MRPNHMLHPERDTWLHHAPWCSVIYVPDRDHLNLRRVCAFDPLWQQLPRELAELICRCMRTYWPDASSKIWGKRSVGTIFDIDATGLIYPDQLAHLGIAEFSEMVDVTGIDRTELVQKLILIAGWSVPPLAISNPMSAEQCRKMEAYAQLHFAINLSPTETHVSSSRYDRQHKQAGKLWNIVNGMRHRATETAEPRFTDFGNPYEQAHMLTVHFRGY